MSLLEDIKKKSDKELFEILESPRRAYDIDVLASNEAIKRLSARIDKLEKPEPKKSKKTEEKPEE